jgi:hypothetical protein
MLTHSYKGRVPWGKEPELLNYVIKRRKIAYLPGFWRIILITYGQYFRTTR